MGGEKQVKEKKKEEIPKLTEKDIQNTYNLFLNNFFKEMNVKVTEELKEMGERVKEIFSRKDLTDDQKIKMIDNEVISFAKEESSYCFAPIEWNISGKGKVSFFVTNEKGKRIDYLKGNEQYLRKELLSKARDQHCKGILNFFKDPEQIRLNLDVGTESEELNTLYHDTLAKTLSEKYEGLISFEHQEFKDVVVAKWVGPPREEKKIEFEK